MSKIRTKELLNEVTNHIQNEFGYEVVDSFSDWDGKYSIVVEIPNIPNPKSNGIQYVGKKYKQICEFGVFKNSQKENFIVWDYRDNQPYFNNKHCVFDGGFGRYEFEDRDSFYSYITSDFGETPWFSKLNEENHIN
jgi:hypothetical protein